MFTSQNPNPNAGKRFVLFRPFIALWQWLFPPTVAHRDRQSALSRVAAIAVIILFCGSLMAVPLIFGKGWYNKIQTWQSNSKIDEAEELEKQDRLYEAWNMANDAYALDANNPRALRTLARYYGARGQKQAFYMLDKLEKLGFKPTDDDRLLRIQALMRSNEIKDAQVQIEALLKDSPPSARMVDIADQVMQGRGRSRELLEILRSYVAKTPDDLDIKLKLATREIQFGTTAEIADGMKILWSLAEDPSKAGLGALEMLDQQTIEDAGEQRKLIALLEKHPLAGEEQRIAALRRTVKLEPARKDEIMNKAMEDRRKASREDLVPLARWFVQEGEHERLLGYLKKEVVQDYAPLLGQYLNALTLANRHDELAAIVKDPRTRLSLSDRAFFQAHLAFVTRKSWDDVNKLLVQAVSAAEADMRPQNYLIIAKWAEQHGHPVVAEQAYRVASLNRVGEGIQRQGFDGLLKLTYLNGNSKGFLEATRDTARRWPENQHFLERSLYASLLAGVEIETAIPRVEKLYETKPDDTQRKLLMALVSYWMMEPKGALKYIKQINLSELSPGQGAVLCGILYRVGDQAAAEAKRVAQQISRDAPMLPEERKFLLEVRPDLAAVSGAAQPGQP